MAKRSHVDATGLDLDGFRVDRILMNDPKSKRVHVLGKFKDSEDDAIVTMVKTPFSNDTISKLLSADTTLGMYLYLYDFGGYIIGQKFSAKNLA